MKLCCTADDVAAAAARIEKHIHLTPITTCQTLNDLAGRQLFFKCEQFQKVGAFKFRGACNAVMQLSPAEKERGVVTHSSGNHAQALALAAKLQGLAAHVVMPENSSPVKRNAVLGYGARVISCAATQADREQTVLQVQQETGGTLIHPYDHPHIIAGQGTAARELLQQVDQLSAIIAPVGGGGLISGTCAAAPPEVPIFAAEPQGADDAFRSKAAGQRILLEKADTIADGLRTSLGEHTWPFVEQRVQAVLTVSEEEIVCAMRLAWERAKLLIEPSSAVALAAVLGDAFRGLPGLPRVGVILSGGNVDLENLPW